MKAEDTAEAVKQELREVVESDPQPISERRWKTLQAKAFLLLLERTKAQVR